MSDYLNLIKEYDEINSNYEAINSDYDLIDKCINHFISTILSLEQSKINTSSVKDNSLIFFLENYKYSVEKIKQSLNIDKEDILSPLKNICENQSTQMKNIINSFKKIKNDLFEGKLKLNNAKKEYIELLKEDNKIKETTNKNDNSEDIFKSDDNLIFDAKKNSYFILYKYQLEKLNEKIDKSNKKYNELKPEIESMHIEKENTYKIVILKFAKMAGIIGNLLVELKNVLEGKLMNNLDENTNTTQYCESEKDNIKERFKKEKLEMQLDIQLLKNEKINEDEKNVIKDENKIEENKNNDDPLNVNKKKIKPKKSLDGLDFEILNEPFSFEDPVLISLLIEIIQKLLSDKEVSSSKISQLLENMKFDSDYSIKFLEELKKKCKNNITKIKNEQNFVHLSNIFNELLLSKTNTIGVTSEIIELTKMIKYNDIYISTLIRKKNKIITSKTFWMNLIDKNIEYRLIEYINNIPKENKMTKNANKKVSEKIINILNGIPLYKKLNKKQKTQAEEYAKEEILYIISRAIINMCNYINSKDLIMDIILHYVEIFQLDVEPCYYFENLLSIKFIKNYIGKEQKQEKLMNTSLFIILNMAKYLPKNEYINLLKLNKSIYSKARKYLMYDRLSSNINISIEERIQLWEIFLNVKEVQKNYNYKTIKENYINNSSKKNYYGIAKSKYLNIIDLDLDRTPLFCTQETHKIKASFILKCATTIDPDINYYQGMNYLLLFLYQILNHDEEKTFYFFYALIIEMKYYEVFNNDMKDLVKYFKIFERLLEINYPDIYDSLSQKQVMTQFYATQWFITIFNSDIEEYEREKIPKFLIMAFESFLYSRWNGILNVGLSLCYFKRDKILSLNASNLMKFMIKELNNTKDINENEFREIKKIFRNNLEKNDDKLFEKLINIINFEEEHPLLKGKEI